MISGDFHLFFVFLLFNIVERQYKRNGKDMDENNVPDMRPTFEEIRKVDDNGKEYWSSRELCNAMGYSGYWKFHGLSHRRSSEASYKVASRRASTGLPAASKICMVQVSSVLSCASPPPLCVHRK